MARILGSELTLQDEGLPVPDEELRWRVTGVRDLPEADFRAGGLDSLRDFQRALRYAGVDDLDVERLLDFGCGPGRVMRHLAPLADRVSLHGCDIDADAVAWASEHLPFAAFAINDGLPPLPYEDAYFDLVLNHSVFTHLPEDYQDAWLEELRRVVRPGGLVLLSVHGPHAFAGYVQAWRDWPADPSHLEQEMAEKGFLYIAEDSWQGSSFPDFYHSAFHTPGYVVEHWGRYLRVLAYYPRGGLDYQDVVLLRRD
jgi:SAM-dependent methyltransferase